MKRGAGGGEGQVGRKHHGPDSNASEEEARTGFPGRLAAGREGGEQTLHSGGVTLRGWGSRSGREGEGVNLSVS